MLSFQIDFPKFSCDLYCNTGLIKALRAKNRRAKLHQRNSTHIPQSKASKYYCSTLTRVFYSSTMFLPENAMGPGADLAEKQRKEAFKKIEQWSMNIIPEPLRDDVDVSVQEVQCGDPQCSPIDTAISVVFNRYVAAHVE
jgi:hypothetical protein